MERRAREMRPCAAEADCPVGMPSLDKLLRDPSDSITHGVNGFTPRKVPDRFNGCPGSTCDLGSPDNRVRRFEDARRDGRVQQHWAPSEVGDRLGNKGNVISLRVERADYENARSFTRKLFEEANEIAIAGLIHRCHRTLRDRGKSSKS